MARDLQKVEKEIKEHIKALYKEGQMWEQTLARAQHTRMGSPRPLRRRGKLVGGHK
jgi:hypothetical protein